MSGKITIRLLEEHIVLIYMLPCVMAVLCYVNGLQGHFVHDDIFAIKNNPDVLGISSVFGVFFNDFWGMSMRHVNSHKSYRPLSVLTFRLDYLVSGGNPVWFHAVNIALHTSVTLMFTRVCLRVLHTSHLVALLAGSIFAVHPIHTEAVTGLVGRADVLAALFFLLSFDTYNRCIVSSLNPEVDVNSNKVKTPVTMETLSSQMVHLSLSLLLAAAAMLCKETGITVLGVSLIFDLLLNGKRIVWDIRQGHMSATTLHCLIRYQCLILTGGTLLMFRMWIMDFQQPQVFTEDANPASFSQSTLTRFMTYLYLPTFNFWLLLCPAKLSYDWAGTSIPLLTSILDIRNLCSFVFYSTSFLLLVTSMRRVWSMDKCNFKRSEIVLAMSLCLLAIPFLPASNIFFRVGFVLAERVLYIPSMGYCLLLAHGLLTARSLLPRVRGHLLTIFVVTLLVLAIRTLDRNQVWRSRHDLFWSGVHTLPHNDKIHYNLGNLLRDEGDLQHAEKHYRTAISLNPNIASYHLNLGAILTNTTETKRCYREALRLRPQHVGALVNMASLLLTEGDQSGMSLLKQALAIDPNHLEAVVTMANTLLLKNDLKEAGRYSKHAINIRPDSAKAHLCHGIFLHNSGQTGLALREYETALRLEPDNTNALLNSARIYYSNGQLNEARTQLEKAVHVDHDCSDCLALLGSIYSRQGAGRDAVITLGQAAALAPNNTNINLKYVKALKESHQHDKARSVLQELMCRVPNNLVILKFAFTFSMELKQYSDALQQIQEMINMVEQTGDSSLSLLYRDQGEAHRYNNDISSALKSFEKAIQLNSTFVEAIIDAGSMHFLQKNFAKAESYYLKALKLDGSNTLAKLNLEKVRHNLPQSGRGKS